MSQRLSNRLLKLKARVHATQNELSEEFGTLENKARNRFQQLLDRFDTQELEALFEHFREEKENLEPIDDNQILRELPVRHTLSMSLDESLLRRHSTRDFSGEIISDSDLATILWACNGINRKSFKRTTPSAMNWQDVSVYVVMANGIWKYLPKRHALLFIRGEDYRDAFGEIKTLLRLASAHLVFVSDKRKMNTLPTKLVNKAFDTTVNEGTFSDRARALNVGVKLQAAAMATAGLGLAGVTRMMLNDTQARQLLGLSNEQEIMALYSVGYPSESILDHVF